jgi:Ni/Co efflux regulator RcnB
MKKFIVAAMAGLLSLAPMTSGTALAEPNHRGGYGDHDRRDRGDWRRDRYERGYERGYDRGHNRAWRRGDRIPHEYRRHYREVNWRRYGYREPPRGYHYVRDDRGETLLIGIATGAVLGVILSQ